MLICAPSCCQETPTKEKILFLGWRRDMDDMIDVLDDFVCKGSELWLYSEVPLEMREELLMKVRTPALCCALAGRGACLSSAVGAFMLSAACCRAA